MSKKIKITKKEARKILRGLILLRELPQPRVGFKSREQAEAYTQAWNGGAIDVRERLLCLLDLSEADEATLESEFNYLRPGGKAPFYMGLEAEVLRAEAPQPEPAQVRHFDGSELPE